MEPYHISKGYRLRPYQIRAAQAIYDGKEMPYHALTFRRDGTACVIDMGLGKTIIALTSLANLYRDKVLTRPTLLVAPILVCETVWRQEAAAWSHTRHLTFSLLRGSPDKKRYELYRSSHIYLVNPEGLNWLYTQLGESWEMFDCLIVDESSMFKSHKSKRFKLLSNYGSQKAIKGPDGRALRDKDGKTVKTPPTSFKRSAILTGTPSPTSYLNLWAPTFLIDHGARLHKNFDTYQEHYFYKSHEVADHIHKYEVKEEYAGDESTRPEWMPKGGAPTRIHELLADITVDLNGEDYGVLPATIGDASKHSKDDPVPPTHLHMVELPPEVRTHYEGLERDALVELGTDFVMASNGGSKSMMCWQMANGFLYKKGDFGENIQANLHALKTQKLVELIETLDANVVVPYYFKADLVNIKEALLAANIPFRTIPKGQSAERVLNDWNAGKIPVLLLHPQSAGHGLNLQMGGHNIIWFSMLWSLERYLQTNARLARSGQDAIVGIHHICAAGTTDMLMLSALGQRGDDQSRFRAALREYQAMKGLDIFADLPPQSPPQSLSDTLWPPTLPDLLSGPVSGLPPII